MEETLNYNNQIKYNYECLKNLINNFNLEVDDDYDKDKVRLDTIITGKCTTLNCLNKFTKKLHALYKNKIFLCKNCMQIERMKKVEKTNIEKYGVSNVFQLNEIKEKIKQNCIKKYGCSHYSKTQEMQDKITKTCLQKYGTKHAIQSIKVQEKVKQTNINNYGVINVLQSKEIKERIKKTCLNKFGVEHASQSEQVRKKMKETCLTKYGVENALQSKETKEQIKKTCLEKYGVEYPLQNSEVAEKSSKNAYSKKIYTFPSGRQEFIQGYENLALDELLQKEKIEENDIITSRKLVPKIWYNDENSKKHRHYVDIFIPSQNKCIEVKSNWTAEKKKDCIYLKQQAAKELGYEYEIWIYNGKFNKVKTIL